MAPDGVRIQAYGKAFLMAVGRCPALPIHRVAWNLGSAYHSPLNRPPASIRQDGVFFNVYSGSRAVPLLKVFGGPGAAHPGPVGCCPHAQPVCSLTIVGGPAARTGTQGSAARTA